MVESVFTSIPYSSNVVAKVWRRLWKQTCSETASSSILLKRSRTTAGPSGASAIFGEGTNHASCSKTCVGEYDDLYRGESRGPVASVSSVNTAEEANIPQEDRTAKSAVATSTPIPARNARKS